MKMAPVGTSSMPMKQTVHLPEIKQSRVRLREPRKICDIPSMSTADKMKVSISKVRVALVPLPNVKAVTAKINKYSKQHKAQA
jgi:hypothetical protein